MSEKENNNIIEEKEEDSVKKDKRKFAAIDELSKIDENYTDIIPENVN